MEFPFNKVVGGDVGRKEEMKEYWRRDVKRLSEKNGEILKDLELELSEEEREDIEMIGGYVNVIASRYGAEEKPATEVVLLEEGGVSKMTGGKFRSGACSQYQRSIIMDESPSRLAFATTLAHEMFHLAGYTTLRFSKNENDVYLSRTGITMESKDGDVEYFKEIEEALVSRAEHMLFDEYLCKDPRYADEIAKTDFVKKWLRKSFEAYGTFSREQEEFLDSVYSFPDIDELIEKLEGNESEQFKFGYLHGYVDEMLEEESVIFHERRGERKKFDSLVDSIMENSAGKYTDRQEILDLFMRAHFSGKLLPLARVVEQSMGKGSFREVAENFASYYDNAQEDMDGQSRENEEGNLDSVHSVEEFNRQDMEELLAKRKAEAEELARRQKEKIEMLEKAEKDGKLTF